MYYHKYTHPNGSSVLMRSHPTEHGCYISGTKKITQADLIKQGWTMHKGAINTKANPIKKHKHG